MAVYEAKKLDFLIAGEPVKARVYADGPEAFAELSGLNLNKPLTYEDVYALRDLFDDVFFELHFAQRKLEEAAKDE